MLINDSHDITFPTVCTVVSGNAVKYYWIDYFQADFFSASLIYQWIAIQSNIVVMTVGITTLCLNVCVSCINHIVCQAIMNREAAKRLEISVQQITGSYRWKVGIRWTFEGPVDSGFISGTHSPSECGPYGWCLINLYWHDILLMFIKVALTF